MEYTILVLGYPASYTGTALPEYFMYRNQITLIIFASMEKSEYCIWFSGIKKNYLYLFWRRLMCWFLGHLNKNSHLQRFKIMVNNRLYYFILSDFHEFYDILVLELV